MSTKNYLKMDKMSLDNFYTVYYRSVDVTEATLYVNIIVHTSDYKPMNMYINHGFIYV